MKTLSVPLKAAPYAAVILAIAVTFAAQAQTPMPDPLDDRSVRRLDKMEKVVRELRAIVFQGRDSGRPVVVQDAETPAMLADLTDRLESLESSLTRVNATNEELALDLDRTKQALAASEANSRILADRLTALEQRMGALETANLPPGPEESAAAPEEAAIDPDALFARGRQQMADGDYSAAEVSFDRYVDTFGDTPKAPEARYWLGKTLSARGDNAGAASAYLGAVRGWPKTSWAPDAVVELARSLVAQKLPADACTTLAELPRRYPNASASVNARAQAVRQQAKCAG
ncbi:MAG TPA: tol-pal system protein YbgF [Caulobacter sp.]|nr:tol-pal system protein YbgF [Caulobacter sp.]